MVLGKSGRWSVLDRKWGGLTVLLRVASLFLLAVSQRVTDDSKLSKYIDNLDVMSVI